MRIGVDVRCLSLPITGIGQYTFQLLSHMTEIGHEWVLYSHSPLVIQPPDRENITVRTLTLRRRWIATLWSQTILPMWVKRDSLDIFWSPRHHLPLWLPKHIGRVVTIHDMVWRRFPKTMRRMNYMAEALFMPRAVKAADAIICVSQSTARDLMAEMPKSRDRIRVIPEGVVQLREAITSEELNRLGINKQYILFVGTLEPRKNLKGLLTAFSLLPTSMKNEHQIVIAGGGGWGPDDLNCLEKELGLKGKICVVGYVSGAILASLMQHAKVFCHAIAI